MFRSIIFPLIIGVLSSSCSSQTVATSGSRRLPSIPALPQQSVSAIGQRIWQNECAGTVSGLVTWNVGEDFPSLGIGHFIWFPQGVQPAFKESWPSLVRFAEARGVAVPRYLKGYAPWPNRAAFLADRSGRADQMRQWLREHIDIQTAFLVQRSRAALPAMLRASSQPQDVAARYYALARSTRGNYCLIDYVNFKGEGLTPTERYQGQGWGLLQVLETMQGRPQGETATAEFSRAAGAVLTRRVHNAPASRGESRWLASWMNRCASYK